MNKTKRRKSTLQWNAILNTGTTDNSVTEAGGVPYLRYFERGLWSTKEKALFRHRAMLKLRIPVSQIFFLTWSNGPIWPIRVHLQPHRIASLGTVPSSPDGSALKDQSMQPRRSQMFLPPPPDHLPGLLSLLLCGSSQAHICTFRLVSCLHAHP